MAAVETGGVQPNPSTMSLKKTISFHKKTQSQHSLISETAQTVNASHTSVQTTSTKTVSSGPPAMGMFARALQAFDKKGKLSKFFGLVGASNVLTAYMGFVNPVKRRRDYLIPKDRAAWLEWMLKMVKKKVTVEYLNDKELKQVIVRARPKLSPYKKYQGPTEDLDLPPCIEWTAEQVGDWLESVGWGQLRETFVNNCITGRRLVLVDCSALNKMGMTDLTSMREIAGKIRDLLGIPPPNGMRPLMRIPPFERFLHRKVYNGRRYDEMTFQRFCETEGFAYDIIQYNKNAQIPCTTEVVITTPDHVDSEEDDEDLDDELSLRNAPTVEFLVRNALIRNKLVDEIMEDLLESAVLPPGERKYGRDIWGKMKRGLGEGYDDLHLYHPKDRLEYASGVANALLDELYKTVAILNDINQLQKHIRETITPEEMQVFRQRAKTLMEDVAPIAALLALGELDLESIFKQQPEFEEYVDDIIEEAERKTNELVPEAKLLVDEVIAEALTRVSQSQQPQ